MNVRKAIGPLLAVLLLAGVGFAIYKSIREKKQTDQQIRVRVLSGSEKLSFLNDPDLAKVLAAEGIGITVEKSGSREIATRPDLKTFDVAYPAGQPAAVKIAQITGSKRVYASFYTPIAVASWKQLIPVLQESGLVAEKQGSWFIVNMSKLLDMMEKGTRWKDLPGNTVYAVGKSVLVTSTDVRKSNSGALYLALAAYLANGNNVVETDADADRVGDRMVSLFSRQGYQENTSAGPFEDYVSMGMGKTPLVMIYEQQFLEYALQRSTVNPDMVLLYPAPTILTKHTLVTLSDKGERFAKVMTTNEKVFSIAHRYGFRTEINTELYSLAEAHKLSLPHTLVDVVDPPTYEILERMIGRVDAALSK